MGLQCRDKNEDFNDENPGGECQLKLNYTRLLVRAMFSAAVSFPTWKLNEPVIRNIEQWLHFMDTSCSEMSCFYITMSYETVAYGVVVVASFTIYQTTKEKI